MRTVIVTVRLPKRIYKRWVLITTRGDIVVAENRVMRKWTWERVQKAVEKNLPQWSIDQEKPELIDSNLKIKLLCPRGHENEKEARKVELGKKSLGCRECIRENQAKTTYSRFVEALKKKGMENGFSF